VFVPDVAYKPWVCVIDYLVYSLGSQFISGSEIHNLFVGVSRASYYSNARKSKSHIVYSSFAKLFENHNVMVNADVSKKFPANLGLLALFLLFLRLLAEANTEPLVNIFQAIVFHTLSFSMSASARTRGIRVPFKIPFEMVSSMSIAIGKGVDSS